MQDKAISGEERAWKKKARQGQLERAEDPVLLPSPRCQKNRVFASPEEKRILRKANPALLSLLPLPILDKERYIVGNQNRSCFSRPSRKKTRRPGAAEEKRKECKDDPICISLLSRAGSNEKENRGRDDRPISVQGQMRAPQGRVLAPRESRIGFDNCPGGLQVLPGEKYDKKEAKGSDRNPGMREKIPRSSKIEEKPLRFSHTIALSGTPVQRWRRAPATALGDPHPMRSQMFAGEKMLARPQEGAGSAPVHAQRSPVSLRSASA